MGILGRLFPKTDPDASLEQQIASVLAERLAELDPWRLPTVVAGRQLTADTVATCTLVAVRAGERIEPTPALLRRPDPREPLRLTLERITNSLTRHGIAWWRIYQNGSDGFPLAIRVIDPTRVQYDLSLTGDEVTAVWIDGIATDLRTVRYLSFISDGLSPIGRAPLVDVRIALEQLVAAYRFAADYYDRAAAVPPYAIVHPTRQTATQAGQFMDQWTQARIDRRPAFLSGGVDLRTFTPQSAADALLVDAIGYLDAVAARAQQIPPTLLNVESLAGSLTYSTTAQELRRWLQLSLYPNYLSRIAAAFTDMLPRGVEAVFDTSNLLRMSLADQIAVYGESLAAGIHELPEVRALLGLAPTGDPRPVPVSPNVEGI